MLTPVDIQQKRFKTGLGFDKKDVTSFFEEVSKSYGELYKSNAELKEKVITLTDTVQHYKVKEEDLNKTLLRAEKNSQESVTNAEKTAKAIEMEAKSHANEIVKDAKAERDQLQEEIVKLAAEYTEYKMNFNRLVRQVSTYLRENDFDPDSDDKSRDYRRKKVEQAANEANNLFEFGGDAQMRETSNLGGGGVTRPTGMKTGLSLAREDKRSNSSNVYGSTLGGDGINPFGD
ncbi:MAG: DivIVA domain-containing protein [Eubacterium sp.]|nr:DivIVA domain-containing protein [Eubacterium sp.]